MAGASRLARRYELKGVVCEPFGGWWDKYIVPAGRTASPWSVTFPAIYLLVPGSTIFKSAVGVLLAACKTRFPSRVVAVAGRTRESQHLFSMNACLLFGRVCPLLYTRGRCFHARRPAACPFGPKPKGPRAWVQRHAFKGLDSKAWVQRPKG
eukprot:360469-Chlamydomonas_euryale.AAC.5